MPVLIFKTNVKTKPQATVIIKLLKEQAPKNNISFDLNDCDKILRVEGDDIHEAKIIEQVSAKGFFVLPL